MTGRWERSFGHMARVVPSSSANYLARYYERIEAEKVQSRPIALLRLALQQLTDPRDSKDWTLLHNEKAMAKLYEEDDDPVPRLVYSSDEDDDNNTR